MRQLFRSLPQYLPHAEAALWALAFGLALLFAIIKIRNWGGPLDAPEQSDYAVFYGSGVLAGTAPQDLFAPERWPVRLGGGEQLPFLYAPAFAWLMQPLARLPYDLSRRVWFWLSAAALAVTAALLPRPHDAGRHARLAAAALWLLAPSTLDVLHLGQVNALLAPLVAAGFAGLYASSQHGAARGALLGLAAAIKPFLAGLLLYAAAARRWRWLAGASAAAVGFVGLGLLALPVEVTLDYARGLLGMTNTLAPVGLDIFWNQSLLAAWRKLALAGPLVLAAQGAAQPVVLRPLAPAWLAQAGAMLSALAVLAVTLRALWLLRGPALVNITLGGSLALLASLLLSPIAWWHYTLMAAPLFAGVVQARPCLPPAWRLLLPLGYALLVAQRGAALLVQRVPFLPLSSLMTVGLLLWWAAFVMAALSQDRPVPAR